MYATILIALDGSRPSVLGGRAALELARRSGAGLVACHVYGAALHRERFIDMEPGLEAKYRDAELLPRLRMGHDSLITEGLKSLSQGYMDDFEAQAVRAGVEVTRLDLEGRNYVRLLEAADETKADLIVMGAYGLGHLDDGLLGSVAARVLRRAGTDVLLVRQEFGGPVLAGLDGSARSLAAFDRALELAGLLDLNCHAAAAFDPHFHKDVFRAMAASLSRERQAQVGLAEQEQLHDRIIDHGLAALYQGFLDAARQRAGEKGQAADYQLLAGKAYRALLDRAEALEAGLVVVGRQGHHAHPSESLGSNAEALARLAKTNLLITAGPGARVEPESSDLEWEAEALARLDRVPEFARAMARQGVEDKVRARGGDKVTLADFLNLAADLGMGKAGRRDGHG